MIGDLTFLGDPVNVGAAGTVYTDGIPLPGPVEVSTIRQNSVHDEGWWEGATANQEYIKPNAGGQPNISRGLGWTTGLGIRRVHANPITGRTLIPPRTMPNPAVGPVGFSTTASKTADRVAAQTVTLPTTQEIAKSFVRPDVTAIIANGGY